MLYGLLSLPVEMEHQLAPGLYVGAFQPVAQQADAIPVDVQGRGENYRQPFIDVLNTRMADYAAFRFEDGEPGYAFKRYLGECVTNSMGPRDRKWISDQVMEIEVPEMLKTLKKGLKDLFESGAAETGVGKAGRAAP